MKEQKMNPEITTKPEKNQLIGRWSIFEADCFDRDYLDLVAPATMTITEQGHGDIAFGALQAGLNLEYGRTIIFFKWRGFDEMDEVTGGGDAELLEANLIEITFEYDNGDTAIFKARRVN